MHDLLRMSLVTYIVILIVEVEDTAPPFSQKQVLDKNKRCTVDSKFPNSPRKEQNSNMICSIPKIIRDILFFVWDCEELVS